ncbi:MAG: hypothetical protein Q7K39_01545 [Candidatus Magasanikbacteria bacterium]|nr:hypothetical protein [Candidatus Magasanikbacteria bacterium]
MKKNWFLVLLAGGAVLALAGVVLLTGVIHYAYHQRHFIAEHQAAFAAEHPTRQGYARAFAHGYGILERRGEGILFVWYAVAESPEVAEVEVHFDIDGAVGEIGDTPGDPDPWLGYTGHDEHDVVVADYTQSLTPARRASWEGDGHLIVDDIMQKLRARTSITTIEIREYLE